MTQGKHRLAPQATKPTVRRPNNRLALIAAPLATAAVVTAGVTLSGSAAPETLHNSASLSAPLLSSAASKSLSSSALTGATRVVSVSRNLDRLATPVATTTKWTTESLDLRLAPGARSKTDGQIASGKRVGLTGLMRDGFAQVVVGQATRWVTAQYLADTKPVDPASMGLQTGACSGTGAVENGLVPGADRVYEAVCHAFPAITTYGGWDAHGEHSSGKAIDIMVGSTGLGPQIADFLRAHAAELNLYDVIWAQHIWTPVRSSEGWRSMPNRGSATANHFDHVHVSVN